MRSSFRRLVAARLISDSGAAAALFVGVWGKATFRLHATPGQMAIAIALWGIGAIAGSATAGVLVDRFDPRRILIAGEVVAIPTTLALILPSSMLSFTLVIPLAAFAGSIIITAVSSFAPYLTDDSARLARVNASMEMVFALSFAIGPALGGLIARLAGLHWIFVANAATSVAALVLLIDVSVRDVQKAPRRRALVELREGIRFAYTMPVVRLTLLIAMAAWMSFGAYMSLEPLFYREVLHSGPALLGWVLATFGLSIFLGSALFGKMSRRRNSLFALVALTSCVGVGEIVYTGTSNVAIVVAGNVIWGLAFGAINPMMRTLIQTETPEQIVGRVTGALVVHERLGQLVPLTFIGVLAAAHGVQRVLVSAGISLIVVCGALAFAAARADRVRVAGGPATALPIQ